jgi:hypothetical protein
MGLPRVRFTVRQMMVAVVVVALVLGMLVACLRLIHQYVSTALIKSRGQAFKSRGQALLFVFGDRTGVRTESGRSRGQALLGQNWAGSPWEIALPGLPQIQTCPIKASGSSCHVLATGRHTEWTAIAGGSG